MQLPRFLAISALGFLQSHISSVQHQKSIAWQVRHRRSGLLLRISFYFGTFYAIGIDPFTIKHLFARFQPPSKSRFRSEERRVGKEWVSMCSYGGAPDTLKKKQR